MNTALWVAQILLALLFLMAGLAKLLQPYEKLKEKMTFANGLSPSVVKGIGLLEVLGAIGVKQAHVARDLDLSFKASGDAVAHVLCEKCCRAAACVHLISGHRRCR